MKSKIVVSFCTILSLFLCLGPLASVASSSKQKIKKRHLWQYKRKHFNYYSLEDDIKIGERYFKKQKESFKKQKLNINPKAWEKTRQHVLKIVQNLSQVSDLPQLPYEVVFFEKPDVANAFCLPGGKIGVFTGIFDSKKGLVDPKNKDQLAAVLAHEMAHATMRHVTRRLTTYNSLGLLGSMVSLGVGRGVGQSWGYLSQQVFSAGSYLYFPGYSRKHEKEADKVGFYYMAKAGYDPKAAIQVWEKAAAIKKKKGKKDKTQFFDSHPASGKRVQYLQYYLADAYEVQKKEALKKKMR